MKIMVFDVPAESGGALSVLNEFYNELKLNQENEYFFVLSLPEFKETSNIKVLRFPWVKKSWGHRLFFDHVIAPRLIKEYEIEQVLSLQNVIIPYTSVYQSVLVHNALPFSEFRFRWREDKLIWVYQNIIGKIIVKSVKKADHIIVQTNWMKKKLVEQLKINADSIEIIKPKVDLEIKEFFQKTKESFSTFFYPASGVVFKNHKVIVDACLKLKEDGINEYTVIFTLNGDENKQIKELFNIVKEKKLPIKFVGILKREELFSLYSKSILIFPSFIETVGLPLIEAMYHNTPILSSNCEYIFEILNNYNEAVMFECFNHIQLSDLLKEKLNLAKLFSYDN